MVDVGGLSPLWVVAPRVSVVLGSLSKLSKPGSSVPPCMVLELLPGFLSVMNRDWDM